MNLQPAQAQGLVSYLQRFIGLPYRWGGDDPMEGFDCSGLVMEGLKRLGVAGSKDDLTADGLYKKFSNTKRPSGEAPALGSLLFWFDAQGRAYHVAVAVGDGSYLAAEAGTSQTTSADIAARQNAFVCERALSNRPGYIVCDIFGWRKSVQPAGADEPKDD